MRMYQSIPNGDFFLSRDVISFSGERAASILGNTCKDSASSAVLIDITNVHDYGIEHGFEGVGESVMYPPFPVTWLEWKQADGTRAAALVIADEYEGNHQQVRVYGFFGEKNGDVVGPMVFHENRYNHHQFSEGWLNDIDGKGAQRAIIVNFAFLAIAFMNCKNVVLEDAPFIGPRQQRRALERKGIKQAKFKTLVIEPMKQVLKTEGGIETNGLKKALHICRGHFATYSEDKPLFGKLSGTFWKPAHVRGSADNGTVYKDYKVKAPKEPA